MMISDKYRQHAYLILEELFRMISFENKQKMLKILNDDKKKEILAKVEKKLLKEQWIDKFIKATKNQRDSSKQWWNKEENKNFKPWLIYFSFRYTQIGYFMLKEMEHFPMNGPYRETVAIYSMNGNYIRNSEIADLFFDDFLEL